MKRMLILSLVLSAWAIAADEPKSAAATKPEAPKDALAAKTVLKRGTPAEALEKQFGKPQEVKEITTPDGKGVAWVYKRLAKTVTRQVAATLETQPVYAGLGQAVSIRDVAVPSYRLERTEIYQMTALLLIDGKLVTAKQWVTEQKQFD